MNLSKNACDTIENSLKHYLKYRVEFGRTVNEQLDMDGEHRLAIYAALEELSAVRSSLNYGDLFGLTDLTPLAAAKMVDIDWSKAPEWAMYWAMDNNGDGYWFEAEPNLGGLIWKAIDGTKYEADYARHTDQWKSTLRQRP